MAVSFRTHLRRISVSTTTVCRVAQSVLELAGQSSKEISLTLVGTVRMQGLNKRFRNRDSPTDVLAFPMGKAPGVSTSFMGDVVICLPLAISQASAFHNSSDEEVLRLIIHGILHLLGYDHEISGREAKLMKRKEQAIFQQLTPVPRLLA